MSVLDSLSSALSVIINATVTSTLTGRGPDEWGPVRAFGLSDVEYWSGGLVHDHEANGLTSKMCALRGRKAGGLAQASPSWRHPGDVPPRLCVHEALEVR